MMKGETKTNQPTQNQGDKTDGTGVTGLSFAPHFCLQLGSPPGPNGIGAVRFPLQSALTPGHVSRTWGRGYCPLLQMRKL